MGRWSTRSISASAGRWANMLELHDRLDTVLPQRIARRRLSGCCAGTWRSGSMARVCVRTSGGRRMRSCERLWLAESFRRCIASLLRGACRLMSAKTPARGDAMSLFPMFLKLTARRCVVVGAGTIAEGKIESLLQAEAQVTVVAPEALPRVR